MPSVYAKFYNLDKRIRSTKRPATEDESIDYAIVFKRPTNIIEPDILLDTAGVYPDFTYCIIQIPLPEMGEDVTKDFYYFVKSITLSTNNTFELHLKLDSLATVKDQILLTQAYVIYSSSDYDRWIKDDRVPIVIKNSEYIETFDNFLVGEETNLFQANTNETVLITTVSQDEGIVTWISSEAGIKDIVATLLDATDNIFDSLSKQFGGAIGSIVQVMRIPIPFEALPNDGNTYPVFLGNYPLLVNGEPIEMYKLSATHISAHADISIPVTYTDFRFTEPYCKAKLTLPFIGCFDFSLSELAPDGGCEVRCDIDLMTGNIMYTLHTGGTAATPAKIIGSYSGQCGSLIPIASQQIANSAAIVGGVLGSAGTFALGTLIGNPAMAVGGGIASITSIASAFYASNEKSTSVIGSYSGGRGEFSDRAARLCVQKFLTACEPSDLTALEGRPCLQVKTLSSLTGFCRTAGFQLGGHWFKDIKDEVNSLMDSGVYIE
jgi:hypothetical protein